MRFELPRSGGERRASLAAARGLAAGTPVVLSAPAPGAAARCRAFATAAGIELEREYLAFPTAAAPAYLVEDVPAPVRLFVTNVLTAPPRTRFALPMEIGLGLLRRLKSWRLVRMLAPGRVVVGRRA